MSGAPDTYDAPMRLASLAPLLFLAACDDCSGGSETPPDAEPVGDCGCAPVDAPPPPDAEIDANIPPDAEIPDAIPPDAQWSPPDPDISGEALVTLHPASIPEQYLVYFRATYAMRAGPNGTARLDATLQPLSYETFEPVGEAFVTTDLLVDAHDGFALDLDGVLPAGANPISGTDVQLDLNLHATVRTNDFACGTVTGTAGSLPAEGSTFGSVRIPDDGANPAPVFACPAD
jgi:hypothetical protein